MNFKAFFNTLTTHSYTLPLVILYVTEGCNLRCISCSYREKLPNELSLEEISSLADALSNFGLKAIVYSGGEPLMRRDFDQICRTFQKRDIKQTLLTNGLLLEKRYEEIHGFLDEIIVSIDGADAATHDGIRGVDSFNQILRGIKRCLASPQRPTIAMRTVIQKRNFRQLPEMVELAKSLGVDRISFLAADVLSDSFGRATRGKVVPNELLMLNESETIELRQIVERVSSAYTQEFGKGFISGSADNLYHIVQYFEALIGKASFPGNTCNAPMVSAVITSNGEVQPCFFLPAFGNVRNEKIQDVMNSNSIRNTRSDVKRYRLERCKTCVCTLHLHPSAALFERF